MHRLLIALCALSLVAACDRAPTAAPAASPAAAAPPPPYQPATNAQQLMQWVLLPAVDVIWDSAGTIITAEGRTELHPTTEAGWTHVRNHAAIVAEVGNLLMMPGRAAGEDWVTHASALTVAGRSAIAAAEARDPDALFDAGGELYVACRGCHEQYWIPFEQTRPGSAPEPGADAP